MKRFVRKASLHGPAAGAAAVLLAALLAAGTEPEGAGTASLPEAAGQAGVQTRRRPGGLADADQQDGRILRRRRPQEPGAAATLDGLEKNTLAHGGIERVYFIHSPRTAPPSPLLPAVLILHGGGGAGAGEMASRTGMNRIADREGFLAVYPQGVDGQWNDGRGKTFRKADDNAGIDDVGFLSAVLDALVRDHRADPDRLYVMGMSNGGMMTHRLGIELGYRLAAIAPVIANLPANIAGMKPAAPPPVLIMNGTADPMMPWNGGPVRVLGQEFGEVLSTDETVRYWVRAAHLSSSPARRKLPDRVRTDRSTVEVDTYSAPGRTGEVVLYRVVGGGHQLPGGDTPDRPHLLGPKNMDIAAAEEIWAFFRRHSRKTAGIGSAAPSRPALRSLDARTQTGAPSGTESTAPLFRTAGRPEAARLAAAQWRPRVRRIGDPAGNYLNVEVSADGQYLVWFEGTAETSNEGVVWHCGIDPATGGLIPPDGRGFRAFEATAWGRANPGLDAAGPYYVGLDREGRLILVRPTGPVSGRTAVLPAPADPLRRSIYPTVLPDQNGGFVYFMRNDRNAGAGTRANGNTSVELQWISLAEPGRVRTVERQSIPALGFAPMDIGFARWMRNRPILTFGATSALDRKIKVRAFDASLPGNGPFDLIDNGHTHIDPYPAALDGYEYILAGIDATADSQVYRRPARSPSNSPFEPFLLLRPPQSDLSQPSLAQSHEPFVFLGRLLTVYQVNDQGRGFFDTTFGRPGELWLADLSSAPPRQWRIAPETPGPVAEPEPLVTPLGAWVYFSAPADAGTGPDEGRGRTPSPRRGPRPLGRSAETPPWHARQAPSGAQRFALFIAELPLELLRSQAPPQDLLRAASVRAASSAGRP